MRALQYQEYDGPLRTVELDEPACPADGVLVAVGATGVCRSDWHAWRGHDPVVLPHVPGHEFAGTVTAVGPEVTGWAVGDRVTAPFVLGCGICEYCLAGDPQVCPDQQQPGFTYAGSFADRVAVPHVATNLVALPDEISFATAASLGCRFATAFRALTGHGGLGPGQWLAVHGCGGVGLSAILIGVALGAQVVAVDTNPAARDLAVELGAAVVVDPGVVGDTAAAVHDLTGGGAHVSIDAIGHPAVAAASVRSLRRRGRHVQVGLLLGENAMTALPMDRVVAWELSVHGSHGMAAADYPAMLALIASGRLDPGRLVRRTLPLSEAEGILAELDGTPGPGITVLIP
ncbi:alcohol dehydrogenase catalytic domain-containing protein [Nakamurella sp. YIM 132087]|uniref:Alcohol dehydrogenase catalytic domain-containing protein n=1 Tax=Nakamurella alba TaxID=2665158 RepID=A0A7K1FR58_9ACTN|nr:zinc-dependent alcohol dehydrogenase family protein [Nakamurella alba]MTD15849.1 alcohol dehydrogenase catalytic domain-containing protein [Nakamurella alba]